MTDTKGRDMPPFFTYIIEVKVIFDNKNLDQPIDAYVSVLYIISTFSISDHQSSIETQ